MHDSEPIDSAMTLPRLEAQAELCPGACGADVNACECWVEQEEARQDAFIDEILSRGPGCYDQNRETWYFDDDWLISAQDGPGNRIVVYYEAAADKAYEVPNEIADWELCVRISEGTVELVPWQ